MHSYELGKGIGLTDRPDTSGLPNGRTGTDRDVTNYTQIAGPRHGAGIPGAVKVIRERTASPSVHAPAEAFQQASPPLMPPWLGLGLTALHARTSCF
ncbi:hypothetical protein SKAU_G00228700 [Synaphobranchus kaupii]|uniref:Uncharacterized protein n=1 Tax=Synaphobranchus kaupii TaxID=118154 RepID=A0A9Q1F575_SYNKA|nr:hypothetical protein SKAU_G00228700 [Synaphobranchus kaupii]